MRAAYRFTEEIAQGLSIPKAIRVELFGSLALTGHGHATDKAILLGLSGAVPETVDTAAIADIIEEIRANATIATIAGRIAFDTSADLVFRTGEFRDGHSNAMCFTATLANGETFAREYHSIGGGVIVTVGQQPVGLGHNVAQPYPFSSAAEMLEIGEETGAFDRRHSRKERNRLAPEGGD